MLIGASGYMVTPGSSRLGNSETTISAATGKMLPPRATSDTVSISGEGQSLLKKEQANIEHAYANGQFVDFRGDDGQVRLGLWALGVGAVDEWSAKGLELTKESLIAAADAFQQGFRQNLAKNADATAGTSVALNAHQIVINSQKVPGWFVQEYNSVLSAIDNPAIKRAFEQGDTFFA